MISKEDLNTLRSKNFQLIFNIGVSGSGKTSQTEKIANEFKYSRLHIDEIVDKETKSKSDLGKEVQKFLEKNEKIPTEILVSILVKNIIESTETSVLIEGFPKTLEEALFFEQNIMPINKIIKYNLKEEVCLARMKEQNKKNFNEDEYKKKFNEELKNIEEIDKFYSPYSIIHNIDSDKSIAEVNSDIKKNLYPVIYSIIGKRYSGKTELSKVMKDKMGISLLDFNQFLAQPEIKERQTENDFVISSFILKLRKMQDQRILIENFPQNKEQYTFFVNNCRPFERIYYLNADNSTCLERLSGKSFNDPNYIDCSKLDQELFEFDQKKPFIDFLKKKSNLIEINVNNHKVLTIERMMKKIQPYLAYFLVENDINPEKKEELFNKVKTNYQFYEIVLSEVLENAIKRNIIPNQKIEEVSTEVKINLIRPMLFREGCNRIILNTFPITMEELNSFESNLCQINKFIVLTENLILSSIQDINSMAVYFYKKNIVATFNPKDNDNDYKIKEALDMTRDINVIYGLPQTGKTSIAKHFKEKFGFELLDFKELTERLKKGKADPENPDAEVELTFPDLLKGLKEYLTKVPLDKRIIVDNVFISNPTEPVLIDSYEKALEVIKTIGSFRNFYETDIDEKILINNYKAKEGIAEEINEDQKAALNESLDKPRKLMEEIRKLSNYNIKIKYGEQNLSSIKTFDEDNGYKFIIIKHEYDIIIEKTLKLFAARNKILYINVPRLIYEHFYENDLEAKKLESVYGKKKFKLDCKNKDNFEEAVYYKYNPINFEKSIVNKVILQYIAKNYRNIETAGNFILLSGYLNYDLLENPEEPYNLPLLEIKNVMELGEFTAFVQITREDIKQEEEEKAEQVVIEKPKKKKAKKEGEEGGEEGGEGGEEGAGEGEEGGEGEGGEEEPPEEENPEGQAKFKPENFAWTSYDGKPRNYVQILKRLKAYPINEIAASDTCREELIKVIGSHIDNYLGRKDSGYTGMITLIKINGEVPEETDESVNKVSRFIETRREAESLKNKGKSIKDKSKAGGITEVL